jgi:hypothetical protein
MYISHVATRGVRRTTSALSVTRLLQLLSCSTMMMGGTDGHSRWSCPEPRSSDTGIKVGPCGDDTNDFDNPLLLSSTSTTTTDDGGDVSSILEISPGPMRVTFVESIHHTGAPFRISLSGESPSSRERARFGRSGPRRIVQFSPTLRAETPSSHTALCVSPKATGPTTCRASFWITSLTTIAARRRCTIRRRTPRTSSRSPSRTCIANRVPSTCRIP